jgi:hypothetical protein
MSNVKPSFSSFLALPPIEEFFSKRSTSNPSAARSIAALKLEKPEPITAIFSMS